MPKKALPRVPFTLTDVDRQVMEATSDDLETFCEWYFGEECVPLPWQSFFYHAPQKRKMAVAGIRSGKTFGVSLGFTHYAYFHPYARLANASISADQAKVVFYNVQQLLSRHRIAKFVKETKLNPYPVILFENGAEIWFRSVGYEAELWRGWEFDWINADEAAYIANYNTITTLEGRLLGKNPMTGRFRDSIFTITSSPKGSRGWMIERWRKGDPRPELLESGECEPDRYLSVRIRTVDNPHVSPEELAASMKALSERQRRQEFEGEFLDPEDTVFSWESITAMCDTMDPLVQALCDEIDVLSELEEGEERFVAKVLDGADYQRFELPPGMDRRYVISWDLGTSGTRHKGRNSTVGFVLDVTTFPWRVVAYRRETKATYGLIIQWIKEWDGKYRAWGRNVVTSVIDQTGSGGVVQEWLQEEHNLDVDGLVYSDASKPDVINAGQVCLERKYVICPPIRVLQDELGGYEIADKRIAQDTVIAFCQGLHRARLLTGDHAPRGKTILPTRTGGRGYDPEAEWEENPRSPAAWRDLSENRYQDRRSNRSSRRRWRR